MWTTQAQHVDTIQKYNKPTKHTAAHFSKRPAQTLLLRWTPPAAPPRSVSTNLAEANDDAKLRPAPGSTHNGGLHPDSAPNPGPARQRVPGLALATHPRPAELRLPLQLREPFQSAREAA